ncbi:hypothetical protein E4L95_02880 [Paracoccus liaowanqingii]|uniref:Uncharacterized protein n=1 Tax=Paracoccus liaowanqingii TaxID=2560053 RepID=A0A4Z1CRQ2_9RHOB|nr:hypothetical protein [Paracoccus liaowanqingii]QDA35729.1 hypothetical protein E4191_16320 [Paracoccus liaowanqingii]TGN68013.1 hypothetical protein E4L95_02880 [Paracoccus liaowanqingii]
MKKANPLLAAMGKVAEPAPLEEKLVADPALTKGSGKRVGQKHLGAYFEKGDPILERVAILRARLDMTNSELIEHALNELWNRHEAGRAFGE